MKLTQSLALCGACLLAPGVAAVSAKDTYKYATEQLEHIDVLTQNLTESIKNWDGKELQYALSNIHEPVVTTVETITNATNALKGRNVHFSIDQSFRIASPTQRLAYSVNASIATLNGRVKTFKEIMIDTITITDLEDLRSASNEFSTTLISFVPSELQGVAKNLEGQIVDSLQMGLDCFNGTESACVTAQADRYRTYNLAVKYDAMRADGSPIA